MADPPGTADPTAVSGPVGAKLTIPTHVTPTGGETTHPSVVFIPGGWNGFAYWMAHTPYPAGNDDHEDPNIVASNDGITWQVPPGLTNPIDDQSGQPEFNSDVDLRLVGDTLYLFWRFFDPNAAGAEENLYYSTSTDGVTWAAKTLFYTSDQTVRRLLSPCLLVEGGTWMMWAVDILPSPNTVVRLTGGALPENAWSAPTIVDVGAMQSGKEPWHLGLIKFSGWYVGLLTDTTLDSSGLDGDDLFIAGQDGLTFANSGGTVIPRDQAGEHDQLYRATLIPQTVGQVAGYRVWYSAWLLGPPQIWNIYRTLIGVPAMPGPQPVANVSEALVRTLSGSHRAVFEARVLDSFQTGDDPSGTEIAILSGDVILDGTAEIRGTLQLDTPGTLGQDGPLAFPRGRNQLLAPYGNEIFVRRGVDLGGEILWFPLGYYRINVPEQPDADDGPIRISGSDRMATIVDSRLLEPRVFEPGDTVADVFAELVGEIYPDFTVAFDDDSGLVTLGRQLVIEESRYQGLYDLVTGLGKIFYWDRSGVLQVTAAPDPEQIVWEVNAGLMGVQTNAARRISREGVPNAVVVTGEGPDENIPIRAVAVDSNPNSPTHFSGRFGRIPRFFHSPILTVQGAAEKAAVGMLQRAIGLPYNVDLASVVNPALDPFQAIRVRYKNGDRDKHLVETVTIPLEAATGMRIGTREQTLVSISTGGG